MSSPTASAGAVIAGCRIDALIGRGGMGVVYRAEHLRLQRSVALKLLVGDEPGWNDLTERFRRESQIAASLHHPNIVTVHDAGEHDGLEYLVMQYVEGGDLRALLRREGPVAPEAALALLDGVASALDAAHARGLVHRDVKPANILVDEERSYLGDFGLTRRTTTASGVTRSGQFLGTLDYAAPEQIRSEAVDGRADVYGLGCVLYECLAGEPPFVRDSPIATVYAHLQDPPPRLGGELGDVIARALAKEPGARQRSCGELIGQAREAAGAVTAAVPTARGPRPAPTADALTRPLPDTGRPHRRAGLVALAGAAVLAAVAAGLAVTSDGDGPTRTQPVADLAAPPVDVTHTPVGSRPFGLAVGRGGVRVAALEERELRRLDPVTGDVERPGVPVSGGPFAVTYASGSYWVTGYRDGTLLRVAPGGGLAAPPVEVGARPVAVAAGIGDGRIWVASEADGTVTPVAVRDVRADRPIRVGVQPSGVATSPGDVWVANRADGTLARIDAARQRVVDRIPVGEEPMGVTIAAGMVWVANSADDTVSRVDLRSGRLVGAPIRVGDRPVALAAGQDYVWVANSGSDDVTRIDPASGRLAGPPIPVEDEPVALRAGAGAVWVSNNDGGSVSRIVRARGG